jgi:hypothetical protein
VALIQKEPDMTSQQPHPATPVEGREEVTPPTLSNRPLAPLNRRPWSHPTTWIVLSLGLVPVVGLAILVYLPLDLREQLDLVQERIDKVVPPLGERERIAITDLRKLSEIGAAYLPAAPALYHPDARALARGMTPRALECLETINKPAVIRLPDDRTDYRPEWMWELLDGLQAAAAIDGRWSDAGRLVLARQRYLHHYWSRYGYSHRLSFARYEQGIRTQLQSLRDQGMPPMESAKILAEARRLIATVLDAEPDQGPFPEIVTPWILYSQSRRSSTEVTPRQLLELSLNNYLFSDQDGFGFHNFLTQPTFVSAHWKLSRARQVMENHVDYPWIQRVASHPILEGMDPMVAGLFWQPVANLRRIELPAYWTHQINETMEQQPERVQKNQSVWITRHGQTIQGIRLSMGSGPEIDPRLTPSEQQLIRDFHWRWDPVEVTTVTEGLVTALQLFPRRAITEILQRNFSYQRNDWSRLMHWRDLRSKNRNLPTPELSPQPYHDLSLRAGTGSAPSQTVVLPHHLQDTTLRFDTSLRPLGMRWLVEGLTSGTRVEMVGWTPETLSAPKTRIGVPKPDPIATQARGWFLAGGGDPKAWELAEIQRETSVPDPGDQRMPKTSGAYCYVSIVYEIGPPKAISPRVESNRFFEAVPSPASPEPDFILKGWPSKP